MHGFYNIALRVDMTQRSFEIETLPDSVLKSTLGGKGLATYLLLKYNPPAVDPLGPENHLIFAIGPVTRTSLWGSCRHGVFTKSPLTGCYAESYSGGTAAESMAAIGADAVMICGRSPEPVWLEITENSVQFHPARDLWGLDTYRTEDRVNAWLKEHRPDCGRAGVLTIGPAGENRVAFAVIENDYWRSAGRTGVGAVMGSKNIKAIAFRGSRARDIADPERMKQFASDLTKTTKDNPAVKAYKTFGTPMLVDSMNKAGGFPTRYWQKGRFERYQAINAAALHERCDVRPHACLKCLMACGRLSTVKEGRHKGLKVEGPEYETIYAFGGLCEIGHIEEILFLNDVCDRLGMDTITAGNLAAFTIEAARKGKADCAIDYGDVDAIAALLEDIAARRGVGAVLANGIRAAAREWGLEEYAIHVKGLEPAGYDPRVLKGMGLAYGTSDRGACHLRATFYKPELAGMVDPNRIEGKAKVFTEWEDRLTLFDTLILCRFYRDLYQWEQLSTIVAASTGLELGVQGLRAIAARVTSDTRRFNLREGLTAADDRLPPRFTRETLPEANGLIRDDEMDFMLQEYYAERGWDSRGNPGSSN
jgi:aldehyde:ferredoxin oxidoreductase